MKKQKGSVQDLTLADIKQQATQLSPEVLQEYLDSAQQDCFAFDLQLKGAQAANDEARAKELTPRLDKAKKQRAYYEEKLKAQFPDYKPTTPNLKAVEQSVVVSEYLRALANQRNAQVESDAAKFLQDETEQKMALLKVQQAMRYKAFYEKRFKRFERELQNTPIRVR